MHFEILVEDQSGKKALEILVPKIIDNDHTFKIYAYKGIGRIPRNLSGNIDASKRILLDRLPNLLKGYGKTFSDYPAAVILICDLDHKCLVEFKKELNLILNSCNPKPETRFCIAIEEFEAWYLGDISALKKAYPKTKDAVLDSYQNDSICGSWEKLADAIYPGGSHALNKKGWQAIGSEKSIWAQKIAPHMSIDTNNSPSFCYFRDKARELSVKAVND